MERIGSEISRVFWRISNEVSDPVSMVSGERLIRTVTGIGQVLYGLIASGNERRIPDRTQRNGGIHYLRFCPECRMLTCPKDSSLECS